MTQFGGNMKNTKIERNPAFPLAHEGARLYILGRTDIYQMNGGKFGAQAGHAATKFVFDTINSTIDTTTADRLKKEIRDWAAQGGGFGTKITLAATQAEILETVEWMQYEDMASDIVIDESYPFTNYKGDLFTAKELTCAYVFADTDTPAHVMEYLRKFKLYD
jgi:peptidyl-tRNA hydrolase